ncbi:porin [Qipengyuania sp. DGS5-3]|uniref:porin n=1 Tax=Qipengyuania sp. DGS5-3 TaxID=3349632 RepID=UPI0036D22449
MTHKIRTALLATAACCATLTSPLSAQESLSASAELEALKSELARLAARVEQLESELETVETKADEASASAQESVKIATSTAASAPTATFKAAPELKGEGGWTFKPRGRINVDAGFVSAPSSTGADSGFDAEARRIRLGVSGKIPGGFGYKVEADFAEDEVALTDAILTYSDGGLTLTAGQHNNFQGLEELSSSLHTSFIERSAWTDAFGFERRIGASAAYSSGDVLIQGGVFADNSADLPNNNWSLDGRLVFAPKLGDTQLHLGGSIHHNMLGEGATVRYRQRPLVHFTDNRFVNTDRFSAVSETGFGLEAAAISGPFHVSVEGYSQNVNRPEGFEDPSFFGGSVELGYFLTKGDTRGYKSGTFNRVKPANPVGAGGIGAVQANIRFDHLDLNDAGIIGGTQDSYQASLIWTMTDYTRLLLNYALLSYDDAAFPTASGSTSYNASVVGVRAQVDF